jgi:hypothetical protein
VLHEFRSSRELLSYPCRSSFLDGFSWVSMVNILRYIKPNRFEKAYSLMTYSNAASLAKG